MVDSLPIKDHEKPMAYQKINDTIQTMCSIITRHKKAIMNEPLAKLSPAITSHEKTADAIIHEQGLLHLFNVEYKAYENAIARDQCAKARLVLTGSELNLAENKLEYILKLIRDKKLDVFIK